MIRIAAAAYAQNPDVFPPNIVARKRVDKADHNWVVRPYPTIDHDIAVFLQWAKIRWCRRCCEPYRYHVFVQVFLEIRMVRCLVDEDLAVVAFEGRYAQPRAGFAEFSTAQVLLQNSFERITLIPVVHETSS